MKRFAAFLALGIVWHGADAWSADEKSARDKTAEEKSAKEKTAEDDASVGPLAAYVAKPDDSFRWVKRRDGKLGKTSYAELILTSQTWRGIVWKHQLFILRPSTTDKNNSHALLFIAGGRWSDELENAPRQERLPREAALFAALAEQLGSPVAVLLQVPRQPIFDGKFEDEIISFTFEKFLRTGEEDWPLLLPMVKSAVRGMDAAQQFAQKEWSHRLATFTVAGASKRGWTTWLTGAVDRRAVAIAPIVIDMLNMARQMQHQKKVWGGYSEQIKDYTELGLQERLNTPPGKRLMQIVDPYSYLDSLKQPKLILIGTNDRYWPLDALNHYWSDLQGDKYILYVPNNGHSLRDFARVIGTINALHQSAAGRMKLPKLSWKLDEDDGGVHLSLQSDQKPRKVRAWVADSESRDFREAKWESFPARANNKGHEYKLARPAKGYRAIFGEAVFDADGTPYFLSTNVKIINAKKQP
ncbi:MAG: PhoPQ-activated pathogenicity protein [Planctomycetes bacterium]|nr:PhoPQ-activated pathogenicity protein [Planctomycetota bacterium]